MSETNETSCAELVQNLVYMLDSLAAGETSLPTRQQRELPVQLRFSLDRLVRSFQTRIAAAAPVEARDELTGLLATSSFRERVTNRLSCNPWPCAMLLLDLKGLKRVNDARGHRVGDQLLALVASRITSALDAAHLRLGGDGAPPFACRLGADEFAIFIENTEKDEAERCARDLLHALREPFFIARRVVLTLANIGIAMAPEHGRYYNHLLRHADLALHAAKAAGPQTVTVFRHAFAEQAHENATKEAMLREALVENQFELHFQPLVRIEPRDTPHQVEALIRWNHPEHGLVMPGMFMPLAEESGLVGDIGRWVIANAIQTSARWQSAGHPYRIAINISSQELMQRDVAGHAREWIARTGAQADLLEIEITETAMMMPDELVLDQLHQLRALGFTLAIDDFGTGYSNLARLTRLPFDRLKIDRSLVREELQQHQREVLICIIGLGKALGCEIVVEGIETAAQAQLFTELGCDLLQGFHLSRPLPETEVLSWLSTMSARMGRAA